MNIIEMLLDFLAGLFGSKKSSGAPTKDTPVRAPAMPSQEKKPPALDPSRYRAWLQAEIAKKGQPPHGYEPLGEPGKPGRVTFCNFFVRSVLLNLFNWRGFENQKTDQAGEMVDYMEAHPETWRKLEGTFTYKTRNKEETRVGPDYDAAVQYATKGCFVMAGWKNPDYPRTSPTGHVCIIAPEGTLIFSNKWGRPVPIAVNAGASNWYGKGLSHAFSEEPNLYLFLGA